MEAIKSNKEIDKILLQKEVRNAAIGEILKAARANNIPVQFVPADKINSMTGKTHQGVLAFMSTVVYQQIDNILPMVYESGSIPLILILDRITDVRNFGAIARTAECAGVHAIVIPTKNTAQINADAVKTSSGAIHNIPICRVVSLKDTIKFLKNSGLQIVACTEKTDETIYSIDFKFPTAIILGNEEEGIAFELIAVADLNAKIPLYGQTESLNASVAASIITYEAIRQRLEV